MSKPTQAQIDTALKHYEELNTERCWASVTMLDDRVYIEMGPIHSNGQCETTTVHRDYYTEPDGTVYWVNRMRP